MGPESPMLIAASILYLALLVLCGWRMNGK